MRLLLSRCGPPTGSRRVGGCVECSSSARGTRAGEACGERVRPWRVRSLQHRPFHNVLHHIVLTIHIVLTSLDLVAGLRAQVPPAVRLLAKRRRPQRGAAARRAAAAAARRPRAPLVRRARHVWVAPKGALPTLGRAVLPDALPGWALLTCKRTAVGTKPCESCSGERARRAVG